MGPSRTILIGAFTLNLNYLTNTTNIREKKIGAYVTQDDRLIMQRLGILKPTGKCAMCKDHHIVMRKEYENWEGQPCTRNIVTEFTNLTEEKSEEKLSEKSSVAEKGIEQTASQIYKFNLSETTSMSKVDSSKQRVQTKEKGKIQKNESLLGLKDNISVLNKASKLTDSSGKKGSKGKKMKEYRRSVSSESRDEESLLTVVQSGEKITTEHGVCSVEVSLTSEVLDWKLQLFDEEAKIIFKQGNYYEGHISNKMMEGNGTFTWTDGSIYRGDFSNGQITGLGYFEWPDLSWYEGEFYCGYRHGLGTFVSSFKHAVYVGHWFMGHKHGQGILYFSDDTNNYYDGDWRMDVRHGEGIRRYSSGACYIGGWQNNLRHGLGTMVWPNNDLYRGGWKYGHMSDYGEYTWSAFLNSQFVYPKEDIYRGSWENDRRHGFGHLELARGGYYKGYWNLDIKHGAGVVVCGNGSTVSQDPLFHYDRPIMIEEEEKQNRTETINCKNSNETTEHNRKQTVQGIETAQEIIKLFPKQKSVEKVVVSNKLLKQHSNVKNNKNHFQMPFKIPMHAPSQEIDLSYHLERWKEFRTKKLFNDYNSIHKKEPKEFNETKKIVADTVKELTSTLSKEVTKKNSMKYVKQETNNNTEKGYHNSINVSGKQIGTNSLKELTVVSSKSIKKEKSKICKRKHNDKYETPLQENTLLLITPEDTITKTVLNEVKNEEKWLRYAITKYLFQLRRLYSQYAAVACHEEPTFNTVLARIMLWQMYRDCHIHNKNITLVQLDKLLATNPSSLISNEHDPFEHIQFWQFLHSLLELSWFSYASKDIEKVNAPGGLAAAFQKLLTEDILPNAGKHIGSVLFAKRDLLPLTAVYLKYREIGEPHSARHFLNKACIKKGESLQRSNAYFIPEFPDHIMNGTNTIGVGGDAMYIQSEEPLSCSIIKKDFKTGLCFTELNSLHLVGSSKTLDCMTQVCPGIKSEEGLICNMEYQLTFLEFYEVLLLFVEMGFYKLEDKMSKQALKVAQEQLLAQNAEQDIHASISVHSIPSTKNTSHKKKRK